MMSKEEMKIIADKRYDELFAKLKDQHRKVQEDFKNVPTSYQRLYLKVHCSDDKSFTDAIRLKCLDCCCWDRTEITNCTVRQCGLHKYRPYQQQ